MAPHLASCARQAASRLGSGPHPASRPSRRAQPGRNQSQACRWRAFLHRHRPRRRRASTNLRASLWPPRASYRRDEWQARARDEYARWFPKVADFIAGATFYRERDNPAMAALLLHQACEHLYQCVLWTFAPHGGRSHALDELRVLGRAAGRAVGGRVAARHTLRAPMLRAPAPRLCRGTLFGALPDRCGRSNLGGGTGRTAPRAGGARLRAKVWSSGRRSGSGKPAWTMMTSSTPPRSALCRRSLACYSACTIFYGVEIDVMADTLVTDADSILACLADARAMIHHQFPAWARERPTPADMSARATVLERRLRFDYRAYLEAAIAECGYVGTITWPEPPATIEADGGGRCALRDSIPSPTFAETHARSSLPDIATVDLWRHVPRWRRRHRERLLQLAHEIRLSGWQAFDTWLADRIASDLLYPSRLPIPRTLRRPLPEQLDPTRRGHDVVCCPDHPAIQRRFDRLPDLTLHVFSVEPTLRPQLCGDRAAVRDQPE